MTILGTFFVFSKFTSVVNSQQEGKTTANVTVSGYLGNINITYNPVNFTAGTGRNPGIVVSKVNNGTSYIIIDMNDSTNIAWDAYMNASNLIPENGVGSFIRPNNMTVWTNCDGGTPLLATNLDYNLIKLCEDIAYNRYFNVSFNLTIPVGQYNNTYYGNLTIYVNSSDSSPGDGSNRTWFGPNNTTVKIIQNIEFWWNANTVNIEFPTMNPNTKSNATNSNHGFPANMTIGDNTNIFVDLYLKGTDLIGLSGQAFDQKYNITIGPYGNLTYSNATNSTVNWPSTIKFLNYSYQAPPNVGDFANWHGVKNYTDVPSFWNISIPISAKQGTYGGEVNAKAVDQGANP